MKMDNNNQQTPNVCPKCGEEKVQCENCENMGCPDCDGYVTTSDDVLLCPECSAALQAEYDKETDNGTKVCGTCSLFADEDTDGDGWCEFHQEPRHCSNYCEDRLPR